MVVHVDQPLLGGGFAPGYSRPQADAQRDIDAGPSSAAQHLPCGDLPATAA
jgi:hypothetical protein